MRTLNLGLFALLIIGTTDSHRYPKCRLLNGYEGECTYLDKCKPLFDLNEKPIKNELELLFLRQSMCGISSSYRYKVCCPPQSEWWRELEVNPILFPELVNYMNDRVPNLGPNKIPGTTDRVGSTVNPSPWNTNQGSNFGQAQGANRPPLFDQTIKNTNSYGFDDYSQKTGQTPFVNPTTSNFNSNAQGFNNNNAQGFNNNNAQGFNNNNAQGFNNNNAQGFNNNNAQGFNNNNGQTTLNGQNGWNSNNLGLGNNQGRRTERPPFQGQSATNANTFENDQSHRGGQTSTVGQNTWNANSQGFGNDQWQTGQTPTGGQTLDVTDKTQSVGQTSEGQTAVGEHPYKFDSIPPKKNQLTSPNSQILPITNSQGFDNGQSQVIQQTTPVQTDLSVNTEKNKIDQTLVGQTVSNEQIVPNANPQEFENDQSQKIGTTPLDEQIALSVNIDEFDNNSMSKDQTIVNNANTPGSDKNPSSEPTNAEKCGVQAAVINAGVVGGETAPEQYPWLALLEYSGGVVNCGGSLISRVHVLTAAHCIDTMRGNPMAVRLSEYNMTTYPVDMAAGSDGARPISITIVPVEWSRMHPQFGHSHYQHDIGLVKMTREVDYTDFVRPICLPQRDYTKRFDVKTQLLVAGWGTDSPKIEEVKVDSQEAYVPIGICNRLVKRALNNKQMCAGERPARRTCVGDYGGPLMLETDNAYVVVGVLSYGPNQCEGGSVPDVSTNVYEYLDWINENMMGLNNLPTTIQS